jgi:hypothetical protein
MLRLEMTVEYDDGTSQVVAVKPSTQIAFERHRGMGLPAALAGQRIEDLMWLAWHASKAGGEFDVWVDRVAGITAKDLESADPTNRTVSTG